MSIVYIVLAPVAIGLLAYATYDSVRLKFELSRWLKRRLDIQSRWDARAMKRAAAKRVYRPNAIELQERFGSRFACIAMLTLLRYSEETGRGKTLETALTVEETKSELFMAILKRAAIEVDEQISQADFQRQSVFFSDGNRCGRS